MDLLVLECDLLLQHGIQLISQVSQHVPNVIQHVTSAIGGTEKKDIFYSLQIEENDQ